MADNSSGSGGGVAANNPLPTLHAPVQVPTGQVPDNQHVSTVGDGVGADTSSMRKYASSLQAVRDSAEPAKQQLLGVSTKPGDFGTARALKQAIDSTADGNSSSGADGAYKALQSIQKTLDTIADGIREAAKRFDDADDAAQRLAGSGS